MAWVHFGRPKEHEETRGADIGEKKNKSGKREDKGNEIHKVHFLGRQTGKMNNCRIKLELVKKVTGNDWGTRMAVEEVT